VGLRFAHRSSRHRFLARLSSFVADDRFAGVLAVFLVIATTLGGFSYHVVALSDRTKSVKTAPPGYAPTWKEHVETIVATDPKDADFSRFMRGQAIRLQRDYYGGGSAGEAGSFEKNTDAGWVEVSETILSASPDVVSVSIGTGFYQAGMAHPNVQGSRTYIWSRRLHRLLTQADVFEVPPDRALRRIAQARFDNQENLFPADAPDGIPLDWDHASIGRDGITWSFGPYELGGYLSAGDATLTWSDLKPYLRRKLPFVASTIRISGGR